MNREIEFRALEIGEDGNFQYGNYYTKAQYYGDVPIVNHFIGFIFEDDHVLYNEECTIFEKTLGQYINEKDLVGSKIYEGDILDFIIGDVRYEGFEVKWKNEWNRWIAEDSDGKHIGLNIGSKFIMGNIHGGE